MKKICYIHGAWATSSGFTYIRKNLPEHEAVTIDYNTDLGLTQIIEKCQNALKPHSGDKISIVGHSLGGLVSLELSHRLKNIDKVITISTPFGGSLHAAYLKWFFPTYRIYHDISPTSRDLIRIRLKGPIKPTLSIVTHGQSSTNPLFGEPNDGVVTLQSQMMLRNTIYKKIQSTHHEVLQDEKTVDEIKNFLWV